MSNDHDEPIEEAAPIDPPGEIRNPTIDELPQGYTYGVTRYADVVLRAAFPARLDDLFMALNTFHPTLDELRAGGGGRTVFVRRFDDSLAGRLGDGQIVWGKKKIAIEKSVAFDGSTTPERVRVRGHEIDMFGVKSPNAAFPGIAVEMEWNNKDPFYDRDLINFQALHREGAIAVGVIVTRGPRLQELIAPLIRSKQGGLKYGQSSTHWNKLVPRVNLGGGGECPLFLVGIEPERILGVDLAVDAKAKLDEAANIETDWRARYADRATAKLRANELRAEARAMLPPVADAGSAE